ncbi:MAG: MFS transporter [Solirubrobacterales bacterium]
MRRLGQGAAFWAVAYAFAVVALGTTLPTPLYGIYREELGFSELTVTVIYATYAVGVISGLLLFGRLSDEIGRRRTLLPGIALSAASAAVFLLAHGLAPLFLGRLLSGLSIGIFTGTATAALIDFAGPGQESRATLGSTFANLGGLSLGPLLTGALAEWAPQPLRLTFWADLALLVPALACIWALPDGERSRGRFRLRPQRLHVPVEMRSIFAKAALVGFVGFAVFGSFTGVASAFLPAVLGVDSHFVVGLVVFLVFASSTIGQLMLGDTEPRAAMRRGCAGLVLGLAIIFAALAAESLALLIVGGIATGIGQGLGFRAALFTVNSAAPPERRAEVASSFFVVAFVGLSLPVVGIGVLAEMTDLQAAGLVFAAAVAIVSAVALALLAREGESRAATG